jgi:predicted kinase
MSPVKPATPPDVREDQRIPPASAHPPYAVLHAVLLAGPPASGKSVLGAALARDLGAVLLDQDVMTGPLTAVLSEALGADGDLDHPLLRQATRQAVYDALLDTAVHNMETGNAVVMVAPFTAERTVPAEWERVRRRLRQAGGEARLVWLSCPDEELVRRMRNRAATRDRSKLADIRGFLASPALRPPVVEHTVVDAMAPMAEQLRQALRAVSGQG